MAHAQQPGAVRRGRHPAARRHGALRSAAFLILLGCAPAAAQPRAADWEALAGGGEPHLAAWLARPGGPLWDPLAGLQADAPPAWAGHVWAAVHAAEEPWAPAGILWPGVEPPRVPLEWSDTLDVDLAKGSAWWGWNAGSIRAGSERRLTPDSRARSVLSLRRGDFERTDHAFVFARADSTLGIGLVSGERKRGPVEAFDRSGEHLYGAALTWRARGHQLQGAYLKRASASKLSGGEEERLEGDSGRLAWAARLLDFHVAARVGRGRSAHQSFGTLPYSRRESQAWWGDVAAAPAQEEQWELRGAWRRPEVVRSNAGAFGPLLATEWWVAARGSLAAARGPLRATLGLGRHTGVKTVQVAPGLEWAPGGREWSGSLWLGRALAPVWTDLAPGRAPFVEESWLAGLGGSWRDAGAGTGARVGLTVGRTRDRALLQRRPLVEEWLRAGAAAAPEDYDFGVLEASAAWRRGRWGMGCSGQAVARDPSAAQPRVDPAHAGVAWVEGGAALFKNDLDARLRLEAESTGPRESDESALRRLPGYVHLHASARLTLADATLVIRALDLADRRAEFVWRDRSTGALARSPGREFQLALFWRLFD